ncbi:MAG: phosphoribosylformylglycinamidine synthase [bacterium]
MTPLILKGGDAFSDFRIANLLEKIKKINKDVAYLSAKFVYFLNIEEKIPTDVLNKANNLLGSEGYFSKEDGFFVTPRKGTISPWSTKATDIFHNAGLKDIKRVERGIYFRILDSKEQIIENNKTLQLFHVLHDRMTEGVYEDINDVFKHVEPAPLVSIRLMEEGISALEKVNTEMGLALSKEEIEYLNDVYTKIKRNPTDVELLMFGQVNSEHCRHKIFNAEWMIDGEKKNKSLFQMIKNTYEKNPKGNLVAYIDNACVIEGHDDFYFEPQRSTNGVYHYDSCKLDMLAKVETHNHPTAISPFSGAATGVGGEIRDEGATGTGSKSKAGLAAFMVSNLKIPGFLMPWEKDYSEFPSRLATPLEIMIEGPIGGASFGNEFGRPQLTGLFKTYEEVHNDRYRGYHKPIMVAGGMGNIKRLHAHKKDIPVKSYIIQLGGPAMKIGIGGGAASSMDTGSNDADLDFNSVQRGNAEMQRRCQEVIDSCLALNEKNPILSIHDIGAGGLSNGCPELVSATGGEFWLRKINNEDLSMSPMEIWCNESQERYVLAIAPEQLDLFVKICEKERCPLAVLGKATGDGHLSLHDEHFDNKPIDIDIGVILHKPPKMLRQVTHLKQEHKPLDLNGIKVLDAVERVLRLPSVANKTFLITIADRSITAMVARDQMVGPYQTPIADAAVTTASYRSNSGEAMAMGERTNIAVVSGPASCRMAIGEAVTNIASTNIGEIGNIKLSANWMCACGEDGEDANLYDSVRTVGEELCPKLGISIPVGKDSLSMRTVWKTAKGREEKMIAPLSLVVSSFAPVKDVRKTVTPNIKDINSSGINISDTKLILLDLGQKKNRLGASAFAQVYNQVGNEHPDLDDPTLFVNFYNAIQEMISQGLILAYHDRSDGGLFVTLAEMAISARCGLKIDIKDLNNDKRSNTINSLSILFSEELGSVVQVANADLVKVNSILEKYTINHISSVIGEPSKDKTFQINYDGKSVYSDSITKLNRSWSELTYRMQEYRDNPESAKQEYDNLLDEKDPGLSFKLTYDPDFNFNISTNTRPKMAILREQGVNGQVEMAASFDKAGFDSVDIHMTDLFNKKFDLKDFNGLVACGGFSYGDVLGAGSGWAKSVLFNEYLKEMFAKFFARKDTFSLGVCNGCQMMSQLKNIIPGAQDWPEFLRNRSEQFEARYVTVELKDSQSILFKGMAGSKLPIPIAHGEGLADFQRTGNYANLKKLNLVSAVYVDNYGKPTERYPFNPNGSIEGITALTTEDGRATIMMPHPERLFRSVIMSYRPNNLFTGENGPWMRIFNNAREFVR